MNCWYGTFLWSGAMACTSNGLQYGWLTLPWSMLTLRVFNISHPCQFSHGCKISASVRRVRLGGTSFVFKLNSFILRQLWLSKLPRPSWASSCGSHFATTLEYTQGRGERSYSSKHGWLDMELFWYLQRRLPHQMVFPVGGSTMPWSMLRLLVLNITQLCRFWPFSEISACCTLSECLADDLHIFVTAHTATCLHRGLKVD